MYIYIYVLYISDFHLTSSIVTVCVHCTCACSLPDEHATHWHVTTHCSTLSQPCNSLCLRWFYVSPTEPNMPEVPASVCNGHPPAQCKLLGRTSRRCFLRYFPEKPVATWIEKTSTLPLCVRRDDFTSDQVAESARGISSRQQRAWVHRECSNFAECGGTQMNEKQSDILLPCLVKSQVLFFLFGWFCYLFLSEPFPYSLTKSWELKTWRQFLIC